jgi:hypothetical protein
LSIIDFARLCSVSLIISSGSIASPSGGSEEGVFPVLKVSLQDFQYGGRREFRDLSDAKIR